jgi:hypothetical protein
MDDKTKKELLDVNLDRIKAKFARKHPRAKECMESINEILKKFGFDFQMPSDVFDFNFHTFPLLKSVRIVNAFIIVNLWAFWIDDHLEHHPEDFDKWFKYVEEKKCPGKNKIEKLFQLVIKECRNVFPNEKCINKLMEIINDWFKCYEKFQNLWRNGTQFSDEELIDYRIIDIGAYLQFYFIEIDSGLEVDEKLANDKDWVEMRKNTIKNLITINELYSLKKEVKNGVGMCNYVYVKMKNKMLTAQEAVEQIITEAETAESLANHHGQNLKQKRNCHLDDYVVQLLATMDGNHYWSTFCNRYNNI